MPRCKACRLPRCISSLRRLCCLLGTTAEPYYRVLPTAPDRHYKDSPRPRGAVLDHSLHRTAGRRCRGQEAAEGKARAHGIVDGDDVARERRVRLGADLRGTGNVAINIYIRLRCNTLARVRILSANGAYSGVLRSTHSSDGPCRRRRRAFRAPAPKTDCRSPRMSGRT